MKNVFIIIITFIMSINCFQHNIQIVEEEKDYIESPQEFRGVWVSPWGGDSDLLTYKNESDYKSKITYILDTIKLYNMNTMIFHVRTHNDALYKSKLNPTSHYFSEVDFTKFDPLDWTIKECHKRGIEFHAWMNPYRVKSNTDNSTSLEEIAKNYSSFPLNPSSKSSNMLKGPDSIILNPGLENVRNFIVDTVIEFMTKYDSIEAIHFDDYFYINMGANGATSGNKTIINEPDQETYEKFIVEHPEYKFDKNKALDKADWRRLQVDFFIEKLQNNMKNFNVKNNKFIELGISPTGIYKNGDGKVAYDDKGNAITNGSDTVGQSHFSSYLFCDTLKWVNNEWISYILPQSYWSLIHPTAKFDKVVDWWNKVIKYKNVNLYAGIGLYISDLSGKGYGWQSDMFELDKQLKIVNDLDKIDGASIYNFHTLRKERDGEDTKSAKQVKNALNNSVWKNIVPSAQKKFIKPIVLPKVSNFKVEGNKLTFDKLNGAKFYCVYRNKEKIQYKSNEIVDIFGSSNELISWQDKQVGYFNYGIKAISYSNSLGDGI